MASQLWGTVSVVDHKRPFAFVAELVLFNALVVPVPPDGDAPEWASGEWDGAKQSELLRAVPDERLRRVPWSARLRGEWRKQYAAAQADFDVCNVAQQRQLHLAGGGTNQKFDAQPFAVTRMLLRDEADARNDRALLEGMPLAKPAVIPAYNGPDSYAADADPEANGHGNSDGGTPNSGAGRVAAGTDAEDDAVRHEPEQARVLRAFGWEFFAPSNEDRPGRELTPRQLIEAAVELEALPEVREHREAFRTWTGEETLEGTDPEAARAKMEDLLARYAQAVRATRRPVKVRRALGIFETGAEVAAPWVPFAGLVGPVLRRLPVQQRLDAAAELPTNLRPAALVHAMRNAFAQSPLPGLALDQNMPLPLDRFWPGPNII